MHRNSSDSELWQADLGDPHSALRARLLCDQGPSRFCSLLATLRREGGGGHGPISRRDSPTFGSLHWPPPGRAVQQYVVCVLERVVPYGMPMMGLVFSQPEF